MRRDLAHIVHSEHRRCGRKYEGPIQPLLGDRDRAVMLFFLSSGPVPQRIEEPPTKRLAVGWSPTRPAKLFGLVDSVNYQRGRILKPEPKDRVSRPSVIFAQRLEESPEQNNDLSQLPHRNGESRFLR